VQTLKSRKENNKKWTFEEANAVKKQKRK